MDGDMVSCLMLSSPVFILRYRHRFLAPSAPFLHFLSAPSSSVSPVHKKKTAPRNVGLTEVLVTAGQNVGRRNTTNRSFKEATDLGRLKVHIPLRGRSFNDSMGRRYISWNVPTVEIGYIITIPVSGMARLVPCCATVYGSETRKGRERCHPRDGTGSKGLLVKRLATIAKRPPPNHWKSFVQIEVSSVGDQLQRVSSNKLPTSDNQNIKTLWCALSRNLLEE